jgi:hypothetical protein
MKLDRRTKPPRLWDFVNSNLPAGLVAKDFPVGYGRFFGIYRKGEVPSFLARAFEFTGSPVAVVYSEGIELHYPEWFSDFEDLLRKWETKTGVEQTLTYWEGT